MVRNLWTEEEIQILKDNYNAMTNSELMQYLPGRTYNSIVAKIKAMRLTDTKPKFNPELPNLNELDMEQMWEAAYAFQKASTKLSTRYDTIDVSINVTVPIGLVFVADLHIGAITTPLEDVRERFELLVNCPYLYCISIGDTTDNYLPQSHPHGMFSTMFPPELQKEMVVHLYSKLEGRWIAAVQGCHEEFSHQTDDFDFTKYLAHHLHCANLGFGGMINLMVGTQLYRIAVRHKYRYNSSYNLTHSPKQLVRFEYPSADIACIAHNHSAAVELVAHSDKQRVYVRPGSMKGPDRYARSLGYGNTGAQMPVVLLWPDKHQMMTFIDVEQALQVLEGLVSSSSKVADSNHPT